MLKSPFFKYLRNEMDRKPGWSPAHKKSDKSGYKGKKIKFKSSDCKTVKRVKKHESWLFSTWGILFLLLPVVLFFPPLAFLYVIFFIFKAALSLSHYEKEFEVEDNNGKENEKQPKI